MSMNTLATVTAIATACCVAAACGDTARTAPAGTASTAVGVACEPVKIALIADKSKSAPGMRTPDVTSEDVDSLLEVVAACGGELAVGVIHDRMTDPFVRVRLAAVPQKAADSQAANKLKRRSEQRIIDRDYDDTVARWEEATTPRVEAFRERVGSLIGHAADANWSPVWDAVARGDLFLAERESGTTTDARRVLLLVSDAVDDVRGAVAQRRAPLQTLKSGATVLIVNGAGTAGSLAGLKPESFEAFDAAVRFVEQLTVAPEMASVAVNPKN